MSAESKRNAYWMRLRRRERAKRKKAANGDAKLAPNGDNQTAEFKASPSVAMAITAARHRAFDAMAATFASRRSFEVLPDGARRTSTETKRRCITESKVEGMDDSTGWSCNVCTNWNLPFYAVCDVCNVPYEISSTNWWECPECDELNAESWTSCRECGFSLRDKTEVKALKTEEPARLEPLPALYLTAFPLEEALTYMNQDLCYREFSKSPGLSGTIRELVKSGKIKAAKVKEYKQESKAESKASTKSKTVTCDLVPDSLDSSKTTLTLIHEAIDNTVHVGIEIQGGKTYCRPVFVVDKTAFGGKRRLYFFSGHMTMQEAAQELFEPMTRLATPRDVASERNCVIRYFSSGYLAKHQRKTQDILAVMYAYNQRRDKEKRLYHETIAAPYIRKKGLCTFVDLACPLPKDVYYITMETTQAKPDVDRDGNYGVCFRGNCHLYPAVDNNGFGFARAGIAEPSVVRYRITEGGALWTKTGSAAYPDVRVYSLAYLESLDAEHKDDEGRKPLLKTCQERDAIVKETRQALFTHLCDMIGGHLPPPVIRLVCEYEDPMERVDPRALFCRVHLYSDKVLPFRQRYKTFEEFALAEMPDKALAVHAEENKSQPISFVAKNSMYLETSPWDDHEPAAGDGDRGTFDFKSIVPIKPWIVDAMD